MPRYIPPGEYEIAYKHSQGGVSQPAIVTLGLRYSGSDFEADYANATNGWSARMMPMFGPAITFVGATYRTNEGTVAETTRAVSGLNANETAPYNVAYLVHKHNFTVGRRGNGRMFLPGVDEESVSPAGALEPSHFATLQTALTAFYDGLVSDEFQPVLFHSPTPDDPTPFSSFVTGFGLDVRVATQRNRLRR